MGQKTVQLEKIWPFFFCNGFKKELKLNYETFDCFQGSPPKQEFSFHFIDIRL